MPREPLRSITVPAGYEIQDFGKGRGMCECGCGELAKPGRRYLMNHDKRVRPAWRVDESGCWVWLNSKTPAGYGHLRGDDGKHIYAHRWSYQNRKGEIPEGMQLDHLCRNRACINPDHLEPVTTKENTNRGDQTTLSDDDVTAIRSSIAPALELASKYGVTRGYIHKLRGTSSGRKVAA